MGEGKTPKCHLVVKKGDMKGVKSKKGGLGTFMGIEFKWKLKTMNV